MKSWLSFFLPKDEYKEKMILYFLSEGAIIFSTLLFVLMIGNIYFHLEVDSYLIILFTIFLFYVVGRYVASGIEYANISTEDEYKKEVRRIFINSIKYVALFIILYLFFIEVPTNDNQWINMIGLFISLLFFYNVFNYFSLKRSFKKNKKLL